MTTALLSYSVKAPGDTGWETCSNGQSVLRDKIRNLLLLNVEFVR